MRVNTIKITGFMPYDGFEGEDYKVVSGITDKVVRIYCRLYASEAFELIRVLTQDEVTDITIN